jgi:hypothetical protein
VVVEDTDRGRIVPRLDHRPAPEQPAIGDGIESIAACNGRRLHRGATGDRLVGVGHGDRRRRQIGAALAIGGRTRATAEEKDPAVHRGADVAQRLETVQQAAQHAVVRRQCQLLA